jgi:hypothetical protein
MNRAAWIFVALGLASALGGWLVTRNDGDPSTVIAPSKPSTDPHGNGSSARESIVVPRAIREPRSDGDTHDHGHDHDHDHGDGTATSDPPCRVLAQVHDEFGRPVIATVTLWERDRELARARTDAEGLATIELDAPRAFVMRVQAEGFVDGEQEIRRGVAEALIDQLVILRAQDIARLQGVVVDESGRPLDPATLGLLGPETERDPAYLAMAIGLAGVPRIVAYAVGGGRLADTLVTDIDPQTGAFAMDVPARFVGGVAFVFGEQALASESWRAGDGPIVLTVPSERRRIATGTLEVDVVDETGVPVRPCELTLLPDRFALSDEPLARPIELALDEDEGPLVIGGAPAVAMIVRARPTDSEWSGASQAVVVEGGRTSRVRLVVTRSASVRVWFVPEREGMAISGPTDLRCITPSGHDVPILVDDAYEGDRIGARLDGLPTGPVALEHDGSLLTLELLPGENPDQMWRVAPLQAFTVRYAPFGGRAARGLDALIVSIDVLTESGYPILRAIEHPEWIDDSTAEFVEWLTPGRYRIELDSGDATPIEREFVLDPGVEDTTVDFR